VTLKQTEQLRRSAAEDTVQVGVRRQRSMILSRTSSAETLQLWISEMLDTVVILAISRLTSQLRYVVSSFISHWLR
jgi:hypothetical protein